VRLAWYNRGLNGNTLPLSQASDTKEHQLKHLIMVAAIAIGLVGQANAQESPLVKSFLSKVDKLKRSLEDEAAKSEAATIEEFELLKEQTIAEIEEARKAKMAQDDLEGALTLRNAATQVELSTWDTARSIRSKKSVWEFVDRNGNRLMKKADGKWVESANESFIWTEKQRSSAYIILYDPKRDLWARLYDDAFFVQNGSMRKDNTWNLMEGKWIK
jgi:hypothetical protein